MRLLYGLTFVLLAIAAGELRAQARPADSVPAEAAYWRARPLPRQLALIRDVTADSTRHRPFFLPRPGEHTAYWVGFGAGLALSPFLWCEGSGCGAVSKASTSLLLGLGGAVTGLLLSRTF